MVRYQREVPSSVLLPNPVLKLNPQWEWEWVWELKKLRLPVLVASLSDQPVSSVG